MEPHVHENIYPKATDEDSTKNIFLPILDDLCARKEYGNIHIILFKRRMLSLEKKIWLVYTDHCGGGIRPSQCKISGTEVDTTYDLS